jgi:hypothetical protein
MAGRVLRIKMKRDSLNIQRVAANIMNKESQTAKKGWSSSLEIQGRLSVPYHKKRRYEFYTGHGRVRSFVNTTVNIQIQ